MSPTFHQNRLTFIQKSPISYQKILYSIYISFFLTKRALHISFDEPHIPTKQLPAPWKEYIRIRLWWWRLLLLLSTCIYTRICPSIFIHVYIYIYIIFNQWYQTTMYVFDDDDCFDYFLHVYIHIYVYVYLYMCIYTYIRSLSNEPNHYVPLWWWRLLLLYRSNTGFFDVAVFCSVCCRTAGIMRCSLCCSVCCSVCSVCCTTAGIMH